MPTATTLAEVNVTEELFPRFHPAHATPDPMVRRFVTMRLPGGAARFEQTDYGHPGRFNRWEPRGIDHALQPRMDELRAVCEALAPILT